MKGQPIPTNSINGLGNDYSTEDTIYEQLIQLLLNNQLILVFSPNVYCRQSFRLSAIIC